MNENLYKLFGKVVISDFNIVDEGLKKTFKLGNNSEYGELVTYSIFPGIVISYIDVYVENINDLFIEEKVNNRLLEINHCLEGRYSYEVADDKTVYFGKGDLCVSVYNLTKSISDFPLNYYKGLEIFIDVDIANDYIKEYIPDFDLIGLYESLYSSQGYMLARSNDKIDHVIGELYNVDERIKDSYYKLKCCELLLFFSITDFSKDESISLSKKQADIINHVHNDLINDLESKITIEELAKKYGISKTSIKNCFKEVYGKPIFKWRKEYKLDYACKLIEEGDYSISEISKMVGYASPSKFSQAFKEYVGCTPRDYKI